MKPAASRSSPSRLDMLLPGIFRAAVPMAAPLVTANCYLIVGGKDAVLVDTAFTPETSWEHIDNLLAHAGIERDALTAIVLTHCHRDHVGNVREVQQATRAPVYMHRDERLTMQWADATHHPLLAGWLKGHAVPDEVVEPMVKSTIYPELPEIVDVVPVENGQVLQVGESSWQFIHTPGHSPGHLCLFDSRTGIIITGDHLLANESSNISVRPGQPYDPLGRYLGALQAVASLPSRLALPGHGEVFTDVGGLVFRQLEHHAVRLADVRHALAGGLRTTYEVTLHIPWINRTTGFLRLEPRHRFLAFGEALAHLEYLEACNEIERTVGGGITGWRPARN